MVAARRAAGARRRATLWITIAKATVPVLPPTGRAGFQLWWRPDGKILSYFAYKDSGGQIAGTYDSLRTVSASSQARAPGRPTARGTPTGRERRDLFVATAGGTARQ